MAPHFRQLGLDLHPRDAVRLFAYDERALNASIEQVDNRNSIGPRVRYKCVATIATDCNHLPRMRHLYPRNDRTMLCIDDHELRTTNNHMQIESFKVYQVAASTTQ